MERRKRICRLCLKKCESFQVLDANTTNILAMLKLKMSLPASGESVMCTNCAETLVNGFNFLATCNDTHHYIVSFLGNKQSAKVDLKKVYLSKKENVFGIPGDHVVCGFCMGLVKSCSAQTIEVENVMLRKCLPELDLSIIGKPIICASCYKSLDICFHFVKDCLSVEEKIQEYCKAVSVDCEDLVELTGVQEYTSRNMLKSVECALDVIKVERNDGKLLGMEKQNLNNVQVVTSSKLLACKEEHVKYGMVDIDGLISVERDYKNVDFEELGDLKCFIKKDGSLMEVQDQNSNSVQQFPAEVEDTKFFIEQDIEVKTERDDFDSFQEPLVEDEITADPLDISVLTHKSSAEVNMFKCKMCSFETRDKYYLKRHVIIHKSPSEVNMLKCEMCSFVTRRKHSLKSHLITHKSPSEITMFKCEMCSFMTIRKNSLKRHLMNHKSPSEITMFRCEMCSFVTRHKHSLKSHLITHESPLDANMIKCEMYSSSQKSSSEVNTFECELCSFVTRHKCSLKTHLITHKNPSEVNMYKCEMCSFVTKFKHSLKTHLITHKSPSEVNMFKCKTCSFETKRKYSLKSHLITHKNPSEVDMFKCEMCSFTTKFKPNLNKHRRTHKSSYKRKEENSPVQHL